MGKNIWREVYRDEAGRKQSRYVFSHCEHCRQRFWKKMPWGRFCSTKCRVYYKRRVSANATSTNLGAQGVHMPTNSPPLKANVQ